LNTTTTTTNSTRTVCQYLSKSSVVNCTGVETFECAVKANLVDLGTATYRLPHLHIVAHKPEGEFKQLHIVSRKSNMTITTVNPLTKKNVLLSIYSSPKVSAPGFLIEDIKCWERIVKLGGDELNTRFSLIIGQ